MSATMTAARTSIGPTAGLERPTLAVTTLRRPPAIEREQAVALAMQALRLVTDPEAADRDALYATDFRHYGPARAVLSPACPAGLEHAPAFSNPELRVRRIVAGADRAVAYVTFAGTHSGELDGCPATGARRQADGYVVFRIADGRITEQWSVLRWK